MKWNILATRGGRGDAELDTMLAKLTDAAEGRGAGAGRCVQAGDRDAIARVSLRLDQVPAIAIEILEHCHGAIGFMPGRFRGT